MTALPAPRLDPTPIFEHIRGSFATELLAAGVFHFRVFERLAGRSAAFDDLRRDIGLSERAAHVLITALRAMGLLAATPAGVLSLTPMAAEHLVPGGEFDVSDYVGLHGGTPGVQALAERLKSDQPASAKADEGKAYIYREGMDSAMEQDASARRLTLALAGRAKNVAPVLAERAPLAGAKLLLDVGGGTGIYAIACLRRYPQLRAVVWDRPAVLKVAAEMAAHYGVADRLVCTPGDMFADPFPAGADVILLSNILHDWHVPECRTLVKRCAAALPARGRLLIHDVFLDDDLGGPLPIALYSAALFSLTEGRAYSAAEYRAWLTEAGLRPEPAVPTLIHCGVLAGVKGPSSSVG